MTQPWVKSYLAETKTTLEKFSSLSYMNWIQEKHYQFQHAMQPKSLLDNESHSMTEKEYNEKFDEFLNKGGHK